MRKLCIWSPNGDTETLYLISEKGLEGRALRLSFSSWTIKRIEFLFCSLTWVKTNGLVFFYVVYLCHRPCLLGWSQCCLDLLMEESFLELRRDIRAINFQLIMSPSFCLLTSMGAFSVCQDSLTYISSSWTTVYWAYRNPVVTPIWNSYVCLSNILIQTSVASYWILRIWKEPYTPKHGISFICSTNSNSLFLDKLLGQMPGPLGWGCGQKQD